MQTPHRNDGTSMKTSYSTLRTCNRGGSRLLLILTLGALLLSAGCGGDNGTNPINKPKPRIVDIPEVSELSSAQATISWTTDIEATSAVLFGTVSGSYPRKDSSNALKTTFHRRTLTSLTSNTLYYFVVRSRSEGGVISSEEGTFQTGMAPADIAAAAWDLYRQAKIGEAVAMFETLRQAQAQSFEAFTGLGWCYAHPQIDSLEKAVGFFSGSLALYAVNADASAGRGFVRLALNQFTQAIADFDKVLSINPAYKFAYDARVSAAAVRLGLAEAHFYLQNFTAAQGQIDQLAAGNGLQPGTPATWSVEGVLYASYPEALLAWIEKLKALG